MFENEEEALAEEMLHDFPDSAKVAVANSIQAGCLASMKAAQSMDSMRIPRSSYFTEASGLTYNINNLLTKSIDANNWPWIVYREDSTGRGRPIVHYTVGGSIDFHIKKNHSPKRLPNPSKYRLQEAKNNGSMMEVLPGFEEKKPAYMIVTFNHKNFNLRYVQIGMADKDYTRWLRRCSLMEYIQLDQVEQMQKMYTPEIEAQVETIEKKYKLEMRG